MEPRHLARLGQPDTERLVNEISDEAQQEISAAINASARQSIRPYNSQNEYLFAMKEDLSEWLQILHSETINAYSFFRKLETGILLCKHANTVTLHAEEFRMTNPNHPSLEKLKLPQNSVRFNEGRNVKSESFFARDNVAQFIRWCRVELGISDTIMFETEDLVLRKNEKNFILTLLEVARRGAKFGMDAPTIIKMEQEIEREMMIDAGELEPEEVNYADEEPEPVQPQKVTIDFKSLDEMVQYYLGLCTCPTMFALTRVSDGKYRIGDSNALIYMRILRNHVMVRVGGGWDTLENYLNKHDPCRCNRHRAEKYMKSSFIVERRENGHVINTGRLPNSPSTSRDRSKTPTRKPKNLTPTRDSTGLNQSLPVDSTRRTRPLKTNGESSAAKMKQRRSQTPSRTSTPRTPTQRRKPMESTPRAKSATLAGRNAHSDPPINRTRKMTSAERTYGRGQGSRESSVDRTLEISVYDDSSQGDSRLTLNDLEPSQYAQDDLYVPKRPNSAAEKSLQNLSLSVNSGVRRLKANPRQEMRPGSSRSRIPVPVARNNNNTRSPSPFFSQESPERADSGIDIYTDFESPTSTMRRCRQPSNRPPDIIE